MRRPKGAVKNAHESYWLQSHFFDPETAFHNTVREILDPTRQPGPVKSMKDFSKAEIAEMEARYR